MEAEIEGALIALNQGPADPYEEDGAADIILAYREARRASKDHRTKAEDRRDLRTPSDAKNRTNRYQNNVKDVIHI